MRTAVVIILFLISRSGLAQDNNVLSFNEYLGYVKKYHPIAKQAELTIGLGQANLMKARGAFDPKIEADYDKKNFKGSEYYDKLNATFKVPTWFGLEFKAGFEQNEGVFLNPEANVPTDGLYNAGISLDAFGILINDRVATLKKAKLFREQTKADRDILVNEILFEASNAYLTWLRTYNETKIYESFLSNAETRFQGIKSSVLAGDKASIDSVEAKIVVQDRALNLEQAKVRYMKASLELSNFLWLNDNIPVELQPNVVPNTMIVDEIDETLSIEGAVFEQFEIEDHPKIRSLNFKLQRLEVERRLKVRNLLPKLDVEYNFLTESADRLNTFQTENYKGGITFRFPLFLRKERGDLKLAKFKIRDTDFEILSTELAIKNKTSAIYQEISSLERQNTLIVDMVSNYETMLRAEERKFSFGESSLFLINSRELKLIDMKLKQVGTMNKYFMAKVALFNSLAINPENL
ncbi:TolC family protein [Sungkyunkwania multivorans]|uniref:TolC family protein n=1 Tax=Sungkyunkwania multivorans TaxID=1173618 RepID=A0ABW3CY08_9FLAO